MIIPLKQLFTDLTSQKFFRYILYDLLGYEPFTLLSVARHSIQLLNMDEFRAPENTDFFTPVHSRIVRRSAHHIKIRRSFHQFHCYDTPPVRYMFPNVQSMSRSHYYIIIIIETIVFPDLPFQSRICICIAFNFYPVKGIRCHHNDIGPRLPGFLFLQNTDFPIYLFQILKKRLPDILIIQHLVLSPFSHIRLFPVNHSLPSRPKIPVHHGKRQAKRQNIRQRP